MPTVAVWQIRAGANAALADFALEHGVIAIGWDDVPDLRHRHTGATDAAHGSAARAARIPLRRRHLGRRRQRHREPVE